MGFSTSLNFTSANEDGATELQALDLTPDDRVLCLTASGARSLDLLLGNPGEVVSLDLNPAQNYLLALKIAAYRILPDRELYQFLGLAPCADRLMLHSRLESALQPAVRTFWQGHRRSVRSGIWHAGRWERVLSYGAKALRLIRGRNIDALFSASTLGEQSEIWRQRFDDRIWRRSIRGLARPWFWTRIIGEPGGAFLPDPEIVEQRIAGAFIDASQRFFFRDSDFATLMLRGHHTLYAALPLHLQRQNLDTVRDRIDRIRIVGGDLATLDKATHGTFSAFSLSDFGSYCTQASYDACWNGILQVAQPIARFCERSFMNPLVPSASARARITVDHPRSAALSRNDKAIIYSIIAGTID